MNRDRAFLGHMLDEARFLRNHSKGLRLASLLKNPILQRSFIRSFEVLGEASKNVSLEFKGAHPEVDWRNIGGLRDRLIHHYFGVDWPILWDILRHKLPALEKNLEGYLRDLEE